MKKNFPWRKLRRVYLAHLVILLITFIYFIYKSLLVGAIASESLPAKVECCNTYILGLVFWLKIQGNLDLSATQLI